MTLTVKAVKFHRYLWLSHDRLVALASRVMFCSCTTLAGEQSVAFHHTTSVPAGCCRGSGTIHGRLLRRRKFTLKFDSPAVVQSLPVLVFLFLLDNHFVCEPLSAGPMWARSNCPYPFTSQLPHLWLSLLLFIFPFLALFIFLLFRSFFFYQNRPTPFTGQRS